MNNEEWVTSSVMLRLGGQPVEMEITIPASPVKPQRMLPILHKMTNAFVDQGVEAAEAGGASVSCKAGCGACCRQPVPISEVEAYQIAELVEAMPEPRRSVVKNRFAEAVESFEKIGWFDDIRSRVRLTPTEPRPVAAARMVELAMKYFAAGVACPFLENESCSVHEARPLACREYLVTTPAENCSRPTPQSVRLVELMAKPSAALRLATRTERLDEIGFLPLVGALQFAAAFPDGYGERSGRDWMTDIFNALTSMSGNDAEPKTAAVAAASRRTAVAAARPRAAKRRRRR